MISTSCNKIRKKRNKEQKWNTTLPYYGKRDLLPCGENEQERPTSGKSKEINRET